MSDHSSDRFSRPPPETPRSEPEIIPPGRSDPRGGWPIEEAGPRDGAGDCASHAVFITVDDEGRARYRSFTPPGPFMIGLVLTLLGLVGAAILLLALGFVLFLIPVAALAVGALLISGRVRRWWNGIGRN